jgi:hypothetical protein
MPGDSPSDLVDRADRVGDAAVPAPTAPPVGDGRGLIRAFGIVQIVFGGLCCLGLLVVAAVALYAGTVRLLAGSLIYGIPAANLLSTGIGSIRLAPWARLATLISAFLWLGLIGLAGAVLLFSRSGGNGYERFMLGAFLFVALALALVLIAVYTRPSLCAAFERGRGG